MTRTDDTAKVLSGIKDYLHVDLTNEELYIQSVGISIEDGMQKIIVTIYSDNGVYRSNRDQHFNQFNNLPIECFSDELKYIHEILEHSDYRVNLGTDSELRAFFAGRITGIKNYQANKIYELVKSVQEEDNLQK